MRKKDTTEFPARHRKFMTAIKTVIHRLDALQVDLLKEKPRAVPEDADNVSTECASEASYWRLNFKHLEGCLEFEKMKTYATLYSLREGYIKHKTCEKELQEIDKAFVNMIQEHEKQILDRSSVALQAGLHRVAVNQALELRDQFHKQQLAEYGAHLTRKVKPLKRPILDFQNRTRYAPDPAKFSPSLPLEVKLLVYSFCDLETCVSLREVDSEWYDLFQQMQHLLKHKMRICNPWIKPGRKGGYAKTWSDCVLVFVKRLQKVKLGKWTSEDKAKRVQKREQFHKPSYVVARDLMTEESLPDGFTSLVDEPEGVPQPIFNPWTMNPPRRNDGTPQQNMDSWTMERRPEQGPFEVLVEDTTKTVIKYKKIEGITLPASIRREDIVSLDSNDPFVSSVTLLRSFIAVHLICGRLMVFPRAKPHYKYSMTIDPECSEIRTIPKEVDGVLVVETIEAETSRYSVVDLKRRQITCIFSHQHKDEPCYPVAFYNGFLWLQQRERLRPMIVDLRETSSKKLFTMRHRILDLETPPNGHKRLALVQGDVSRDFGRYLVGELTKESAQVIDLGTGISTTVVVADPEQKSRQRRWVVRPQKAFFVGLRDGQFEAYWTCLNWKR